MVGISPGILAILAILAAWLWDTEEYGFFLPVTLIGVWWLTVICWLLLAAFRR
jgi:hypothetical protein